MIASAAGIALGSVAAVVGGLVVTAIGAALAANKRPLDPQERDAATKVFGPSLNCDRVRLATSAIIGFGSNARALPGAIYFPPKALTGDYLPWLMHELTHSWQYQHGVSMFETIWNAIRRDYDYGDEAGLLAASAAGRRFGEFNTEEQGDIVRDYYCAMRAGRSTAAFDPFIAELRGA